MKRFIITLLTAWVFCQNTHANHIELYEFDSPQQEAQYRGLIEEFRCPKCQNQNLAGSDAPIAQDLKQKTYEMVQDGRSDAEIRSYMLERYGDFISYKPPVRPSTWILWFFPPVLLIVLVFGWVYKTRKNRIIGKSDYVQLSCEEEAKLSKILQQHQKDSDNNIKKDKS